MKPVRELTTLYYLKNRKRLLEYQAKYYQQHSEERKAYQRLYSLGHYGDLKEISRRYREKNREKLRKYMREYQRKRRENMKKARSESKFVHTAKTQKGMGDFYGTGIKAKLGRMRDDSMGMNVMTPKKLKIPPRSVV